MFGLFNKRRSSRSTLERQYARLLEEAVRLQRQGKIPQYAAKTSEAEAIREQLDALDEAQHVSN